MPARKVTGPSLFCEWVVGTTIPSAIKPSPVPKPKPKPRFRDVVNVQVTTDDESEEDTVRITYPRTGRTIPPPPSDDSEEVKEEVAEDVGEEEKEEVVKKVRFEETTKPTPIKSALKKNKTNPPAPESEEASDSSTEAKTDSEVESSDDPVKAAKNKRLKKKQKPASEPDSEYDSDPHPTCMCESCAKGREMLATVCKKHTKSSDETGIKTSESDTDASSEKGKKQSGGNGKKGSGKKGKGSDTESETSESSKDASDIELEKPAKGDSKKNQTNREDSDTATEVSESEPKTPAKAKKQSSNKEAKKGGQSKHKKKQTSKKKSDPEPESEPEAEPEPELQPESGIEADDEAEDKDDETSASNGKTHRRKEKKVHMSPTEQQASENSRSKGENKNKKANRLEGFPPPNVRRPNLIQPVRAEVVQTERVVEGPLDPPPNAYYDPSHNVVRVYYGPAYGNHHGYNLYPNQGDAQPLPVGIPHPTQNPYFHGFNTQQRPLPQPQSQPLQQGYGYNNIPITQGMPMSQWTSMAPPPGFPHVPPGPPVTHQGGQGTKSDNGPYMSGALVPPPSSKGKDKDGVNNIGPDDSKESKNPYYNPSRARSQFSAYGSTSRRHASGTKPSAQEGGRSESEQKWSNNDGTGDPAGAWEDQDRKSNQWGETTQSRNQGGWSGGSNHGSHRSNATQRKQGEHWGEDTFPQPRYGSDDWNNNGNQLSSDKMPVSGSWEEGAGDNYNGGTKSNIMPGTWVDTHAATCPVSDQPGWGDPSCAADTRGAVEHW